MQQKASVKVRSAYGLEVSSSRAFALGTAFAYQGRLTFRGRSVTGIYDLTNALHDASHGGAQIGPVLTLVAVPVTHGLFTVLLDFGPVVSGTGYWLQMGVRRNGVGSYTALSPRQKLASAPRAITAEPEALLRQLCPEQRPCSVRLSELEAGLRSSRFQPARDANPCLCYTAY
jgi:hypothetical protein